MEIQRLATGDFASSSFNVGDFGEDLRSRLSRGSGLGAQGFSSDLAPRQTQDQGKGGPTVEESLSHKMAGALTVFLKYRIPDRRYKLLAA
jgi:hypothetical protein